MRTDVLLWEVSDLHLELTRGWDLPSAGARPKFDVMVVAGDLIPRMERGVDDPVSRNTDRQRPTQLAPASLGARHPGRRAGAYFREYRSSHRGAVGSPNRRPALADEVLVRGPGIGHRA